MPLTGSVNVLTVITYCLLMKYTGILSRQVILPTKSLRDNVVAFLSQRWPELFIGAPGKDSRLSVSDWVVFCRLPSGEAMGFSKIEKGWNDLSYEERTMIRFQSFSPVMKTFVQIAVWNYLSYWLVLVMIVNSLLYNGFLTNNYSNDGKLRLFLVGIYALANYGHQIYNSTLFYRDFSFAIYQSCYIMLCRFFVFLPTEDYVSMTMYRICKGQASSFRYGNRLKDTEDTT